MDFHKADYRKQEHSLAAWVHLGWLNYSRLIIFLFMTDLGSQLNSLGLCTWKLDSLNDWIFPFPLIWEILTSLPLLSLQTISKQYYLFSFEIVFKFIFTLAVVYLCLHFLRTLKCINVVFSMSILQC